MSNKTQLQTNNTRLASLIEELKGKATGSDGAVETCTVNVIINDGGYLSECLATVVINNLIEPFTFIGTTSFDEDAVTTLTIPNVLCGSAIEVKSINIPIPGITCGGGAEYISHGYVNTTFFIKAPMESSAVGQVIIYDND